MTNAVTASVIHSCCLKHLKTMKSDSVDLVFGSPPYEDKRTYDEANFKLRGNAWLDWMFEICVEAGRVCKGMVAIVCDGRMKDFRYNLMPEKLQVRLDAAGFNFRRPFHFCRHGVAGSGGPDDLKSSYEYVIRFARPGRLPWADNVACGSPPKYKPGGEMSHRLKDGERVNEAHRRKAGDESKKVYTPPALANPGNAWDEGCPDHAWLAVGGGRYGWPKATENEAPFPPGLAEIFIRSFCPLGGTVYDPWAGAGTTAQVALELGRHSISTDIRRSHCDLTEERIAWTRAKMQETLTQVPTTKP